MKKIVFGKQQRPIKIQKVGSSEKLFFQSVREAARHLDVNQGSITRVCQGENFQTRGHICRYATEEEIENYNASINE